MKQENTSFRSKLFADYAIFMSTVNHWYY